MNISEEPKDEKKSEDAGLNPESDPISEKPESISKKPLASSKISAAASPKKERGGRFMRWVMNGLKEEHSKNSGGDGQGDPEQDSDSKKEKETSLYPSTKYLGPS